MKAFQNIKLYLLLFGSTVLVRRASKKNPRVQQLLEQPPFAFQILTADGAAAYLELRNGKFKMHRGVHPSPGLTQSWVSTKDALFVMLHRDETELLRAAEAGKCSLKGSFGVGLWMNEAMKLSRG